MTDSRTISITERSERVITMKSTMKSAFAFIAVALMIMVAVVPMVSVFTEENGTDAATTATTGVSDIKIQLFEKDTTAAASYYADLIYCSNNTHRLPDTVNATQYVEVLGGVWMNVDANSADYGKFLTYGQTGMTTAQIITQSTEGGDWLPLIQISATYDSEIIWDASVTKTKTDGYYTGSEVATYKPTKTGYDGTVYSFDKTQVITTIKITQNAEGSTYMKVPAPTADSEYYGNYFVDVKINGVSQKTDVITIGEYVKVSGTLKAVTDSNTIVGATIKYTIDGKEETTTSTTGGAYSINVLKGSVLVFKSITYPDNVFTFKNMKSLGTVTAATSDVDFTADQSIATVIVNDASSTAVAIKGAKLSLTWYQQKENSSKYYVETVSDGMAKIVDNSSATGEIKVAYVAPTVKSGYTAILVGSASLASGDYYTFNTKSIETNTSGTGTQISSQIAGYKGTAIIYSGSAQTATINAKESTVTVAVKTATGSNNVVVGATVSASWYESKTSSTLEKEDINAVTGTIKAIGTTDAEGKVKLTYVKPTATTDYNVFMLISATNASGFTFNSKTSLATGTAKDPVQTQINGYTATTKWDVSASVSDVYAKEKAWEINLKVTGVTEDKTVTFNYTDGVGTSVVSGKADASGEATAYFYVLDGKSPAITATLDGYTVTKGGYATWTVPTVTGNIDTAIEFTAVSDTIPVSLDTPNKYGYTKDGKLAKNTAATRGITVVLTKITDGTPVTFDYTVDGVAYKNTVAAANGKAALYIYSWNSVIEFTSVTADGYTIPVVDGVISTPKTIKTYTITFTNDGNAVGAGVSVEVYKNVDEASVATLKTNAIGVATFKIEDLGATTVYFKCNGVYISQATKTSNYKYTVEINKAMDAAPVSVTTYEVYYYATDVNATPEQKTAATMIIAPAEVSVSSTAKVNALAVNGYKFVAWIIDGKVVSTDAEYTLTMTGNATETISALYEQCPVYEPKDNSIDSTTLVIGIAAVIIALIAVVYAVIQSRK